MAPGSLGLWMLFLWTQEGVSADGENTNCGNVTGILGEAVALNCCYSGEELRPNLFRVQWQIPGFYNCVVDAYTPGSTSPQCEDYKNRTELKNESSYLRLQLLNVNLEDSKQYECILQKQGKHIYEKIFHGLIMLEVTDLDSKSPATNPVTHDSQQQTRVIAISSLLPLVVIIIIIVLILYKRKQPLYRYTGPAGMDTS